MTMGRDGEGSWGVRLMILGCKVQVYGVKVKVYGVVE